MDPCMFVCVCDCVCVIVCWQVGLWLIVQLSRKVFVGSFSVHSFLSSDLKLEAPKEARQKKQNKKKKKQTYCSGIPPLCLAVRSETDWISRERSASNAKSRMYVWSDEKVDLKIIFQGRKLCHG